MFDFLHRFDKNGALLAKPGRKAIPVGHKRPETLAEQVARLVRHSEFARVVAAQGLETFEEADDFDIADDEIPLPNTPWERDHDLAAVGGMHGGVVKLPSTEETTRAKSTLQKAKNAFRKHNNPDEVRRVAKEDEPFLGDKKTDSKKESE